MQDKKKIGAYNLKGNQVVLLKKKPENAVFGTNPTMIPLIADPNGLSVPSVLYQMKLGLLVNKGLEKEWIFIKPADDKKTKKLRQNVNMNFDITAEDDAYSIASLIKSWYKELPTPIFSMVKKEDLPTISKSERSALGVFNLLPEPQRTLFHFLMDLLVEATKVSERNKVTPRDLGIVFAPLMIECNKMPQEVAIEFCRNIATTIYFVVGSLGLDAMGASLESRTEEMENPKITREEIKPVLQRS